ncbi:exodeoxyribonuclease III [Brucepastera parasyntrophica]|uniref:exodeoxyribonuclease III n=1 Tax=Brucepastera parasyntrophica TaxID=2880008 RepID=UPI00210B3354|nr:exodeoxyribonuclease III [Brucepastera parasyntrophica]ULQ59348.1 exodeoxyribonuclease III [Brucepastera parasyntrophica]
MKTIVSWNVNGVRAIEKKGFLDWLAAENPDILCLQETKAHKGQLNLLLTEPVFPDGTGYFSWWNSAKKPGYSGTALYSKTEPLNIIDFGYPEFDDEGRTVIAEFPDATVISAYFPNSQEAGARLGYKLDFCAAILETCNRLTKAGKNIILCGDYNIAHKPIDLANPKSNEKNPGYLPEERAWMDTFINSGYTDTFRHFCPDAGHYSWWSYRFNAREKNIGWRIDYISVNNSFISKVTESSILKDVYGSDHCPVKLIYEN